MKRMLKKNIAILLCLCLCLSLFPAAYAEGDVPAEPDGGADVYEQVLTETGEALPEIEDRLIDEEIILDYPEVETLYEEVPGEGEIPEETADAVRETPEEENLSGKLGTAFAGISIPQIEQNEIPESTTRRSYVSAASALLTAESFRDGLCPAARARDGLSVRRDLFLWKYECIHTKLAGFSGLPARLQYASRNYCNDFQQSDDFNYY